MYIHGYLIVLNIQGLYQLKVLAGGLINLLTKPFLMAFSRGKNINIKTIIAPACLF